MNKHARNLRAQNESMDKEAYDLTDNSCGTFVNDVLKAGGVNTPWLLDPRPNSMIGEWQDEGNQRVYDEYQIYLRKVEEDLKRQRK